MAVLLETSLGDLIFDLYTDLCPLACKNFIKLCKLKHYNNALFFSVQKDYLTYVKTQSPPTSIYEMQYGYQGRYFEDEIQPSLKFNETGLLATANSGPNLNDSNIFVTLSGSNLHRFNDKHTIFGKLAEGQDVLQKINDQIVDENNRPYYNIRILHTVILDDPFDELKGITYPDKSPELQKQEGDIRLEFDEQIQLLDENGRTEQEIQEATKEHEAKAKAVVLEMLQDLPDADIKPPDQTLFVCKLNPATTDEDLELIFSRFGSIRSCEVVKDWKTGASLQYAFIEFETTAACEEAYFKMDNAVIDERRIHVDFSQSVSKMWGKFKQNQRGRNNQQSDQQNKDQQQFEVKNRYRRDDKYQMVFDKKQKNYSDDSDNDDKKYKSYYKDDKHQSKKQKKHSRSRSRSRSRDKFKKHKYSNEKEKSHKNHNKSHHKSHRY